MLSKELRSKKHFKTAGEIYRSIKKNKLSTKGTEKFIARSEIFRAEIEAEIIDEKTEEILSRKVEKKIINRVNESARGIAPCVITSLPFRQKNKVPSRRNWKQIKNICLFDD